MRLTTGFSTRTEHPDELDLQAVFEVLESVYEPRRRPWRELESNTVLEAIYCHAPNLRVAQERSEIGSQSAIAHIHRMVAALGSGSAMPPECVPERARRGQRRQGAS